MVNDKQHINLHLDAHTVGLDVPREQEPDYRKAAELLNRRFQYYLKLRPNASAEQKELGAGGERIKQTKCINN